MSSQSLPPRHALQGSIPSLDEASRYCQQLAHRHYENFTVASWCLPRQLRRHFCHLYAYCRWADDLADTPGGRLQAEPLLDWWEAELDACFGGQPRHPVFVALRETVVKFAIPELPFRDLLVAFRRDQQPSEYETMDDLLDYCRYSANPVGRLVLHLAEVHDVARRRLADELCTGLQLVNFWQDVRRDANLGRCYLPRVERERSGYTDQDFAQRRFTPAFAELLAPLVDDAAVRLRCGLDLADRLPRPFRGQVALYAYGGLAVADQLRQLGHNVWAERPRLSRLDKARLLVRATWRAALPARLRNLAVPSAAAESPS